MLSIIQSVSMLVASLQEADYTLYAKSFQRSEHDQRLLEENPDIFGSHPNRLEKTPIFTDVLYAFSDETYNWANWLRRSDSDNTDDWHFIDINPDTSPLIDIDDDYLTAPTKLDAFGWVIERMIRERAEPTAVEITPAGALLIHGATGLIATISRMEFLELPQQMIDRATRALSKLSCTPSTQELGSRLARIDGFGYLATSESPTMELECFDKSFNQIELSANRVRDILQATLQPYVHEKIKLSFAQEAVSRFFGFPDWNTFKGLEKKRKNSVFVPFRVSRGSTLTGSEYLLGVHRFYRNAVEAIVAFGQEVKGAGNGYIWASNEYRFSLKARLPELTSGNDGFLWMNQIIPSESDEDYSGIAAQLLQSEDISASIREYFLTGEPPLERYIALNSKAGRIRRTTTW